jgi:hypothetical protein
MARSCCPSYTISCAISSSSPCFSSVPDSPNSLHSLDASEFRPSRSQRQVVQRFNAFVQYGEREGQPGYGPLSGKKSDDVKMGDTSKGKRDKGKGKANTGASEDWGELVTAAEWAKSPKERPFKHRFEVSPKSRCLLSLC